jgi:serine/threonine protein phosphatase PrpC
VVVESRHIKVLFTSDEHGNPLGPARVWLKNQDIPGLAMSRSLGDGIAASVGVICDPEILEFNMTSEDKFIVIGSDGIFEFLSNEEVVKLVVPFWKLNDVQGACDILVKEAHNRWVNVRVM